MANKKITDLPDIGTPASGDLLEIVDISEGVSKRVAVSNLGSSLQVYESGETPIENVDEIEFDGATVTDDGGGKVTVTVTGGGGIPDAPNDTFGYIRKDLSWTKINIIDLLTVGNREINLAIDENILFDGGVFAQVISCAGLGGDTTIIIPISTDGNFPEYIIHNETDYVIDLVSEEPILAPLIGNNFIIPKNSLCFIRPMYNTDLVVGWSVTYQLNEVSGGNFIPLSGTEVGNPVTGDIEMNGGVLKVYDSENDVTGYFEGSFFSVDALSFFFRRRDIGADVRVVFPTTSSTVVGLDFSNLTGGKSIGVKNKDGLIVVEEVINGGIIGENDYSTDDPTNLNIYAQRQYVQNQIQNTTITIELFDALEVDFYAPDDLKINSTAVIVGSGTITLKVNNVAYTLGALINQGDKITVTTTALSTVVNLVGKYE